jgi:hypothetical protein
MNKTDQMRQRIKEYHRKHGEEFRLKCMIGQQKGLARCAKTAMKREVHERRALEIQAELDKLIETIKEV